MIIKRFKIINQGVINVNYCSSACNAKKDDDFNGFGELDFGGNDESYCDENCAVVVENSTEIDLFDILNEYKTRKIQNMRLEVAYQKLGFLSKAERVYLCSTMLEFWVTGEKKKLVKANFCRERLCPSCAWRRSLKMYSENRRCFDEIGGNGRFLFLTLTCKNVCGEDLKSEIERYTSGFGKLVRRKSVKGYLLGMIRALEVTYNDEKDTYHPHIHCLLHVSGDYFSHGYLTQERWRKMWREIMELNYDPKVDVRVFKSRTKGKEVGRELAEISKYCVKFSDIMNLSDKRFLEVVKVLDDSLYRKRLISFSGTFKEARRELHMLDDIQDSDNFDQVDIGGENDEGYKVMYKWHFGRKAYERME